ncbi:MAG: YbaB/EbfC family nucleoid-associated protein [Pseudomonadota bacterium]
MDFMKMMKQAKDMQSKMQDLQAKFDTIEVTGTSGGGRVEITLTVKGDLRGIRIDPSLLSADEAETIEDLIMVAHKQAREKAHNTVQEKTQGVMSGMGLPAGMKLPF